VLVRRGDVAGHFLLLTSGRALVAFGEQGAQKVTAVPEGSILGEMALLRGTRRSATVTAVTETRGMVAGRAAFTRLLAIPGVLEKVVITTGPPALPGRPAHTGGPRNARSAATPQPGPRPPSPAPRPTIQVICIAVH
jgi:hypothetical protein